MRQRGPVSAAPRRPKPARAAHAPSDTPGTGLSHSAPGIVPPGSTVKAARAALAQAFARTGVEEPALDARLLLQHALHCGHGALAAGAERLLSEEEAERIALYCARRLWREPVAYIVGEKEFWGLALHVNHATLVPRPDTETVVEAALAALAPGGTSQRPLLVADLGTGSGAILLALLSALPAARGIGVDISRAASAIAHGNAARLGFAARAAFIVGDLTAPLAEGFDLVVSNPPYIASRAIDLLAPEIRNHEPRTALDGGADGLDYYRRLAVEAGRIVAPGGHLVVEIGQGQEEAVCDLFASGAWQPAAPARNDLTGTPRALVLCRS